MKKFICLIASAFSLSMPATAFATKSFLQCQPLTKGAIVIISLHAKKKFGKLLNCIDGEFISDMEPCAPENGFGLSYPTGAAQLRAITFRWQDLKDHLGGVTSSTITETTIAFSGEFRSGDDVSDLWFFEIDRLTGDGSLKVFEEKKTFNTKYKCNKVNRKF